MYRTIKYAALLVLVSISALNGVETAHAQDTGLCPAQFFEGFVDTGSVECISSTILRLDRAEAETDRIELEAICSAEANSEVTNSLIFATSSGRFFASVTCTIDRPVPPGTVLCPGDSVEVFRAFDTMICNYPGEVVPNVSAGQTILSAQGAECSSSPTGQILDSRIGMGSVIDIPFLFTVLSCGLQIPHTGIVECPHGFDENSRTEDAIECRTDHGLLVSLEEAEEVNQAAQTICTDTTAGLGIVTEQMVGAGSLGEFFSFVTCSVGIPRFSEFADQSIIRACDATCTEDVDQIRVCLNRGQIGEPGCIGPAIRQIERRCNTGPDRQGLCPIMADAATIIVPLLLSDDDD